MLVFFSASTRGEVKGAQVWFADVDCFCFSLGLGKDFFRKKWIRVLSNDWEEGANDFRGYWVV
jgi:hypothetical protein